MGFVLTLSSHKYFLPLSLSNLRPEIEMEYLTHKFTEDELSMIFALHEKLKQEGNEFYYTSYKDTGMCYNCFYIILQVKSICNKLKSGRCDGDLDEAEEFMWNFCFEGSLLICKSRQECSMEGRRNRKDIVGEIDEKEDSSPPEDEE